MSLARKPVTIHARKAMTPARKERIWSAHLGRCEGCQEPVPMDGPGVEYDHINPLWRGGEDTDANLQTLCPPCHRFKTIADAKPRAKAKRLAKETGQDRRKREIPNRGFDQRLTKGFDGKVRPRVSRPSPDHVERGR